MQDKIKNMRIYAWIAEDIIMRKMCLVSPAETDIESAKLHNPSNSRLVEFEFNRVVTKNPEGKRKESPKDSIQDAAKDLKKIANKIIIKPEIRISGNNCYIGEICISLLIESECEMDGEYNLPLKWQVKSRFFCNRMDAVKEAFEKEIGKILIVEKIPVG